MFESASFIISNTDLAKCPTPDKPEMAFIGRSNVGKSSLINMLTKKKGLAKTSSKPGKTQLINHFLIDDEWYLVDLPGYGYAKTSKKNREAWGKMIEDYILNRENLSIVFVLIDSRLDPQKIDVEFINWLGENGVPLCLVYTKADKQSINKAQQNMAKMRKVLKKNWEFLPDAHLTSSTNEYGRDGLIHYIDSILKN